MLDSVSSGRLLAWSGSGLQGDCLILEVRVPFDLVGALSTSEVGDRR